MQLTLDGSVSGNATATNLSVPLTTVNANDIIAVCVITNGGPVDHISDDIGFPWALQAIANSSISNETVELWTAKATGILTANNIKVFNASSAFITVTAFGIAGVDTNTIFDNNGLLPWQQSGPLTGGDDPVTFTTNNAYDFLIANYRFHSQSNPTQGTGWTLISGANFQLVEYKIVSSLQSGTTAPIGTGNTDENGSVGHAIMQAPLLGRLISLRGSQQLVGI